MFQVDFYGNKVCPGNATSASASTSAAPSSAAASIGTGAIAGIAVGAAAVAIVAAVAVWLFVAARRRKQKEHDLSSLPLHKQYSPDGKVRRPLFCNTQDFQDVLHMLCGLFPILKDLVNRRCLSR